MSGVAMLMVYTVHDRARVRARARYILDIFSIATFSTRFLIKCGIPGVPNMSKDMDMDMDVICVSTRTSRYAVRLFVVRAVVYPIAPYLADLRTT